MIYAVHIIDEKFVKIGFSDGDLSNRIATLQTGCPFEIRELFTIEGSLRQEKSLHSALLRGFARVKIPMPPNEWYPGKNAFFQKFLADLRFGFDAGLGYIERYSPSLSQGSMCKGNGEFEPNLKWPSK